MSVGDELADTATPARRLVTAALALVFGSLFSGAAWFLAGNVQDVAEDAPVLGGAVLMGIIAAMCTLTAALSVRPEWARHRVVGGVLAAFGVMCILIYRVFVQG